MIQKKTIVYSPSNAKSLEELINYVEKFFRDIIEVINADIAPTFIEHIEQPKNPKTGTVYYASGITSIGPPSSGWNPLGGVPSIGLGKGLYLYTETSTGIFNWKKLDT